MKLMAKRMPMDQTRVKIQKGAGIVTVRGIYGRTALEIKKADRDKARHPGDDGR